MVLHGWDTTLTGRRSTWRHRGAGERAKRIGGPSRAPIGAGTKPPGHRRFILAIVYAVAALLLATTEAAAEATSASDAAPGVSMSGPVRLAQNEEKKSDDDELLDEDEDELLDEDEDELLDEDEEEKAAEPEKAEETRAAAAHDALFAENRYPSATTCSICHPKHYKEWSVSQHAYAQLSPVYLALQNFINLQINGTQGDFCMRCHNQVGMNMGEKTMISNLRRHPTSREGITCIVCHRTSTEW
jgi:hypothetical protein